MANIKYADTSNPLIAPTDDDQVMFKTGAGGDGRAPLVQPKGYIDGLKLEWVSGTQVRVTPGAAYVPGPKRIAELASAVVLSPSLAASTWYHVYLTVAGGVVSAEASTTAPAAPYTGTARAKTGDTSRRYIGSFRTTAASSITQFLMVDRTITYVVNTAGTPYTVVDNGTSNVVASVSVAALVPLTSRAALAYIYNTSTNAFTYISNSEGPDASSAFVVYAPPSNTVSFSIPLASDQSYTYRMNAVTSAGSYHRIYGYTFER